jgi:hypothetical protein
MKRQNVSPPKLVLLFSKNLSGKAYDFVLHWKQQVLKYEAPAREETPPKQMLQHAASNIPHIAYIKQVWDQDLAQENHNRDVFTIEIFGHSEHNTFNGTSNGEFKFFKDGFNPFDDIMEEEFVFFEADPETWDIMEGNTKSNHLGKRQTTGDGKPKLIILPPGEWIILKQELKDQDIAERDQEHLVDKPFHCSYQTSLQKQ